MISNLGGGWVVGGGFLLHNHATSWSNLQDCKISSTAEIPKLDRVWQYFTKNIIEDIAETISESVRT